MAQRSPKDWATIALYIGGAYALYLVGRKALEFLSVVPSKEEAAQKKERTQTLSQAQSQLQVKPTKPDFFWKNAADNIYEAWKTSGTDETTVLRNFALVVNDADALKLFQFYGTRQNYTFGIPYGGLKSLSEAANDELSDSDIRKINEDFARKGIKYRI